MRDMVGFIIGSWTVESFSHIDNYRTPYWNTRCTCGNEVKVRSSHLLSGVTTQCQRCNGKANGRRQTTHGRTNSSEYMCWIGMNQRCNNEKSISYKYYGGLEPEPVKVCKRWHQDNSEGLINFVADLGPRPAPEYSIGREADTGDYKPGNARWMSPAEQGHACRVKKEN